MTKPPVAPPLPHLSIPPSPPLVLASISPRRRRLLSLFNIPFTIVPSSVDESQISGNSPEDFARNAAREKALDVTRQTSADETLALKPEPPILPNESPMLSEGSPILGKQTLVLGADTIVILDVESDADRTACQRWPGFQLYPRQDKFVLGKPSTPEEAAEMLQRLSGHTHHVITAVALCQGERTIPQPQTIAVEAETTAVTFKKLTPNEIAAYIATGEPLDKAGSYGIQGHAEKFIQNVDGDLGNVIGLPLPLVFRMLHPHYPAIKMPDTENLSDAYREG